MSLVEAGNLVLSKLGFCNLFSNTLKHLRCWWKATIRKFVSIRNKHLFLRVYELPARVRDSFLDCACFAFIALC